MHITEKQKYHSSLILLVITAVLWSLGGLFIKKVGMHPMAIASMRSLFAIPVMCIIIRPSHFTFSKPQIAGAVFYAICLTLFVAANKLTTAANTIVLQYTAPIYIAILSGWLLAEKITKFDWFSIAAVICGMILFFLDELTGQYIFGNICAVFSGVTFALMMITLRMQKNANPIGA